VLQKVGLMVCHSYNCNAINMDEDWVQT